MMETPMPAQKNRITAGKSCLRMVHVPLVFVPLALVCTASLFGCRELIDTELPEIRTYPGEETVLLQSGRSVGSRRSSRAFGDGSRQGFAGQRVSHTH
jgi:hypothetical protein